LKFVLVVGSVLQIRHLYCIPIHIATHYQKCKWNSHTFLLLSIGDFVQIDFENSTYFANESDGELCATITTIGRLAEPFDVSVIPLETVPVSAEGNLSC